MTSDGGLVLVRELHEHLDFAEQIERHLANQRGKNTSHRLAGLARLNRELIARAEPIDWHRHVVLDMDSTETSVYGQ